MKAETRNEVRCLTEVFSGMLNELRKSLVYNNSNALYKVQHDTFDYLQV